MAAQPTIHVSGNAQPAEEPAAPSTPEGLFPPGSSPAGPSRHSHAPHFASPLRSAYQPSPSPPSSSGPSPAPSISPSQGHAAASDQSFFSSGGAATLATTSAPTPQPAPPRLGRVSSYEPPPARSHATTYGSSSVGDVRHQHAAGEPGGRRLSEPPAHAHVWSPAARLPYDPEEWNEEAQSMTGTPNGTPDAYRRTPSRTGSSASMHGTSMYSDPAYSELALGTQHAPGYAYGAGGSTTGGYASSVEADFYSAPPSRLVSRTPTPVLGLGGAGTAAAHGGGMGGLTLSESDEEEGSSDSRDSAGMAAGRQIGNGLGTLLGWGAAGLRSGIGGAKAPYQALRRSSAGGGKWDSQTAPTPLVETGSHTVRARNASSRADSKSRWSRLRLLDFLDDGSDTSVGGRAYRAQGLPRSRVQPRKRTRNAARGLPNPLRCITSVLSRSFRTVFGPIHPATIMVSLILVAGFVTSVTMLIIYILNPDKEPLPWRSYCAAQMPFPHAYADALAPVDVLVGVMTIDSKYERRNMIRATYASHTLPIGPDGRPTANVQVKFILGKVRKAHARRVALEMEAYNDIVVLDMHENMSARKTLTFMKWAAENATMPFVRPIVPASEAQPYAAAKREPDAEADKRQPIQQHQEPQAEVLWKKVDYVVKADDDAFLVLDELERHLRVSPRRLTYWGYLVKDWFMAGEAYALSMDLVEWLAASPEVERSAKGKEDTRTPQWIALHPNRSSINWVSEHCWIYDHPKAGTPYSHGFLFPDYVERIKAEARRGLSEQEVAYRGGERSSHSYSTVSRWHHAYVAPREDLTAEEEVEALVEGGGRWAGTWVRGTDPSEEAWVPWEELVYENDDERLGSSADDTQQPILAVDVGFDESTGLPIYGPPVVANASAAMPGSITQNMRRSTAPVQAPRSGLQRRAPPPSLDRDQLEVVRRTPGWLSEEELPEGDERTGPYGAAEPEGLLSHLLSPLPELSKLTGAFHAARPHSRERDDGARTSGAPKQRLVPRPTHKDEAGMAAALRARRYLGRAHGGTVVVHYLKKSEWWLETAMALLGRDAMWSPSVGGTAREWRMWGSPLVRHDGYISEGRSQPHPDAGLAVAAGDTPYDRHAEVRQAKAKVARDAPQAAAAAANAQ